jgi:hypothetical protein
MKRLLPLQFNLAVCCVRRPLSRLHLVSSSHPDGLPFLIVPGHRFNTKFKENGPGKSTSFNYLLRVRRPSQSLVSTSWVRLNPSSGWDLASRELGRYVLRVHVSQHQSAVVRRHGNGQACRPERQRHPSATRKRERLGVNERWFLRKSFSSVLR